MGSDSKFLRDEDGNVAVRVVYANPGETIDPDSVFTRDEDGNVAMRVTGNGGGGDSHNKGWFATPAALREAYPTAEDGDFAVVGSTDTIWVWDADTTDWKNTDSRGLVDSVNGMVGAVVLSGEDIEASDGETTDDINTILTAHKTDIDSKIENPTGGTAGQVLKKTSSGEAWEDEGGAVLDVTLNGTSIVEDGVAEIETSDIIKTPTTMPVLDADSWVNNEQTVNVTGVTSSNVVYVSPAPAVIEEYSACGVYAFAQGNGTLSFRCTTVPENDLSVIVIIM